MVCVPDDPVGQEADEMFVLVSVAPLVQTTATQAFPAEFFTYPLLHPKFHFAYTVAVFPNVQPPTPEKSSKEKLKVLVNASEVYHPPKDHVPPVTFTLARFEGVPPKASLVLVLF